MRVKVGNTWYEAEPGQPLAIELTEADKANIADMLPGCTRYAVMHDRDATDHTPQQKMDWLAD
ncbi:hypothetical protein [Aurantiacibacter suaedae]|uniref:hypothetical protein n=1 Tax=Aurantiacibacter suaedae TaxID=2545755 RepID=UPI0010F7F4A5|nr:hypothetical protein [Aurantiacibacter suaedae]